MAFFQVNMFSPVLGFPVDCNVFVPTPNTDEALDNKDGSYFTEETRFPVLYLLHGAYGDHTDWFRLTSIEKYATKHKIAVVMPAVSNSYYQDMYKGSAYMTFLSEELPRFVEKVFPVSTRREETFTAGLSMGGYGALKLALTKPEKFAACAALSGAIDVQTLHGEDIAANADGDFKWRSIFGEKEMIEGTDADIFAMIRSLQQAGREIPRIYQTVGTEDFIYPSNVSARKKMEALGVPLTYIEHPGIHDWDFWDTYIQDVLDWMLPASGNDGPRTDGGDAQGKE